MAIGPVQLVVLGFEHEEFHGEIIAELERLKESDAVRVIDALAVHKDADGGHRGRASEHLPEDEAIELGVALLQTVQARLGPVRVPHSRPPNQPARRPPALMT